MLEGVLGSRSGFYGLPCGEGKSLSWLVPTVISSVSGARRSMRIVVLPYNFLVGHMVQDTINKIGRRLLRPNDAASVTRSTYNRRGALDFLSVRSPFDDNLPSLVFIALDAFALLLKEHSGPLKLMGKLAKVNWARNNNQTAAPRQCSRRSGSTGTSEASRPKVVDGLLGQRSQGPGFPREDENPG